MSRGAMTMRAQVSRALGPVGDGWGHSTPPTFVATATVPCRVWSKARKDVRTDGAEVVVEDIRGVFPAGADLAVDDRIEVTDRLGGVLFNGPLAVDTIVRRGSSQSRNGHIEAMLTRHKGGPN